MARRRATLLLLLGQAAAGRAPPRPLQEGYPIFWAVGGNDRQRAPFQANGSVDLPRFGIRMNNWTVCGGMTAINHSHLQAFPSLDGDGTVHNGGVPQAMNRSYFTHMLSINIAEKMPDPAWAGLGVFDFENWTPIWEQNSEQSNWHGRRYQNYSLHLVRQAHPGWSAQQVTAQAKSDFEQAGIALFVTALRHAAALRPKALWGFCESTRG